PSGGGRGGSRLGRGGRGLGSSRLSTVTALVATLAAALSSHAGLAFLGLHGGRPAGLLLVLGPAGLGLGVLGRGLEIGLGGCRTGVSPAGDVPALVHGLGDDVAHERAGADGVVVAGDDELDDVRIAVGVDDGDDRQPELVGLGDGDVLLLGVDDEEGVGPLVEVPDAAEVALELLRLAT